MNKKMTAGKSLGMCFLLLALVLVGRAAPAVCHTPTESANVQLGQFDAGVDYIFVVDTTGSMNYKVSGGGGQTRWDELHSKLVDNISHIEPGQGYRLHLLVFGGPFSRALNWQPVQAAPVAIPNDKTSAYSFDLKSEADKNALVQTVTTMTKPSAMSTPVRDAVKAAFERALSLRAGGAQKIVIAVFSDGDDNSSEISKSGLESFVGNAQANLGDSLIGSSYLFIRVAGLSIATPTVRASRTVDHTPTFATLNLMPASVEAGSLAAQEETDWIDLQFQSSGLNGQAVPLYFESAPGAPRVQLVCECGKSPVYGVTGAYKVKFRRAAAAAAYEKSFEGLIKLDDRDLSPPGSRTVVQNLSRNGIKVRFAGAPHADLSATEVKPAGGSRVLLGQSVHFEAPARSGAKYSWSFTGADSSHDQRLAFDHIFVRAGTVDIELKLEQPGFAVNPVAFKVDVIDPGLQISSSPSNPVEGETVHLNLNSNPALHVRGVQWIPSPSQAGDKGCDYVFNGVGPREITAIVDTELGQATAKASLVIKPGINAPELVTPEPISDGGEKKRITLYRVSEPQTLVAEVGQGTAAVRFRIVQEGREVFSEDSKAAQRTGALTATAEVGAGGFKVGPASLVLTSIPGDPELTRRLGEKKSEYLVEILRSSVAITKEEPVSAELEWGKAASFVARLDGPGAAKITGIDWHVAVVSKDGTKIELPGRLQAASEFTNGTLSNFELTPERSNPRFASLTSDASIEVTAIPQGDPAIIEGMSVAWTGLSPKFAPAEFVILAPKQANLDEQVKLKVLDKRSGNIPESVSWHVVGENSDALAMQTGAEQQISVANPGSHTVKATVKWAGGEQVCAEQSFYVDYQPLAISGITWDGGKKPTLEHWGKKEADTVTVKGELLGSRADLEVDLKRVVSGRVAGSAPGYPKHKSPSDLAHGFGLEYPKATSSTGEYTATLLAKGLNAQGEPTATAGETFRIINHPSVLVPIIALVLITGALMMFIRHVTTNNVGKYYSYVVLNSENAVKDAFRKSGTKAGPDAGIVNQWRAFIDAIQLKPVGTQSSSWIPPGTGDMAGSWNFRSFRRKRASISLNDAAAFPPALLPAWFKALQGRDAHLLFLFKDGEWIIAERLYEDRNASKPITDATESIKDLSASMNPSWPGKKLYAIEGQGGSKVYVCLWDMSSEEQNEASLKSYMRYGLIANSVLFVGFAALLLKFLA